MQDFCLGICKLMSLNNLSVEEMLSVEGSMERQDTVSISLYWHQVSFTEHLLHARNPHSI